MPTKRLVDKIIAKALRMRLRLVNVSPIITKINMYSIHLKNKLIKLFTKYGPLLIKERALKLINNKRKRYGRKKCVGRWRNSKFGFRIFLKRKPVNANAKNISMAAFEIGIKKIKPYRLNSQT